VAVLLFQRFELVFRRKFRFDDCVTGFETPGDEVRQAVIGLRAKDKINGLGPADDFGTFGLRHTARHRHQHLAA
jgi:hypothetical protein